MLIVQVVTTCICDFSRFTIVRLGLHVVACVITTAVVYIVYIANKSSVIKVTILLSAGIQLCAQTLFRAAGVRMALMDQRLVQELSYRKQIVRQLRSQFVEGISVTLKSTLRVTQGHWKRNHWTGHTRLLDELLDVEYYRDLEMWVRGHSRSLKLVQFESLGAVSYSPSIVTMAVSVAVCEIFSVKEWRDLENQVRGHSRSLKIDHMQLSIGWPL